MLFNSFIFILLFLPVALLGFFAASRFGRRTGAAWLMLASIVFYGAWNPRFVLLLIASIAFNFTMAEAIHASADRPQRQKAILIFAIACDLLVLTYYKYLAALVGFADANGLLHIWLSPIILPLGISFFTFTQIGYLVDVQQDVVEERGLSNYILFVTFFPHLIAGPILHNREIMPQFAKRETYRFSIDNFTAGIVIFIIGLAKKCILADPLASYVQTGFADPHLPLLPSWSTMLCYQLQLYFDFSGYTDMAIGIARMFNVRFPVNFNSPLKAASIIDFWHRWHMTLSRFLNLYLFNPIAFAIVRNRIRRGLPVNKTAQKTPGGFAAMVAFPMLATMALAGVWHGAGLQYLVFGLLHGGYLTVNHAWRMLRPATEAKPSRLTVFGCVLLTFGCVLVALVFFRAPSLAGAGRMLASMAGLHGIGWPTFGSANAAIADRMRAVPVNIGLAKKFSAEVTNVAVAAWVLMLCVIVWALPNTREIMEGAEPAAATARRRLLAWRPTLGWATVMGAMAAFALLAVTGTSEFLYYQF